MNAPTPFGPYSFALTDEEARIAASRVGLRKTLAGRLERRHVAPLVFFVLFVVLIAILAFTGLIGRRLAEAGLIFSALTFMTARLVAHWSLRVAQKDSLSAARALQQVGAARLLVDDEGASLESGSLARRYVFAAGAQVENAGGMIYLWPKDGEPIFIPSRAFPDEDEAARFLKFARSKILGG